MSLAKIEQVTSGQIGASTEFKASETIPQKHCFARIAALDAPTKVAWESIDPSGLCELGICFERAKRRHA